MSEKKAFRFVDLKEKAASDDIQSVFPGWRPGDERVVVFSPHDDDCILGAGHAALAAGAFGGEVHVVIFCNGCAGYSTPEEKASIIETRRRETIAAYGIAGIPEENIHRLEFDDFSVLPYLGWHIPGGADGTFGRTLTLLRRLRATRLVIPNGYREHIDHEATFKSGAYDGPQVGDPIIAELGLADPVRSTLQYAVWGDFSPEEALMDGRDLSIRANTLILCESDTANRLNDALAAWRSQAKIITGLLEAREARRYGDYMMEAYIKFDPRPSLDYAPYARHLESLRI